MFKHLCHVTNRHSISQARLFPVPPRRLFSSTLISLRAVVQVRHRNIATMSTDYVTQKGQAFDRAAFESLLRRKVFLWQSFEPYGSVKVCSFAIPI
jgi:hypothetical protein